jgi:hypothetical protein
MARKEPNTVVSPERKNKAQLPVEVANERLRIGFISGATIMAPIITAELFVISPRVTFIDASVRRKKNPNEGIDPAVRDLASSSAGTLCSK